MDKSKSYNLILITFVEFCLLIPIVNLTTNGNKTTPISLNSDSTYSWTITWGDEHDQEAMGVAIDSEGSINVTGYTITNETGKDLILLKYNPEGYIEWKERWYTNYSEEGKCVAIDSEDNIYVAGYNNGSTYEKKNFLLMKYDKKGDLIWNKTRNNLYEEVAMDIAVSTEDKIYITGHTELYGEGGIDVFTASYNPSGKMNWFNLNGTNLDDYGTGIEIDEQNRITVVGYGIDWNDEESAVERFGYNAEGDIEWKAIEWSSDERYYVKDLVVGNNDYYYMGGYRRSENNPTEYSLLSSKAETNHEEEWIELYESGISVKGEAIALDSNGLVHISGDIIQEGKEDNDIILCKYATFSTFLEAIIWEGKEDDYCKDITFDSRNNMYIVGSTRTKAKGGLDILIIKNLESPVPFVDYLLFSLYIIIGTFGTVIVVYSIVKRRKYKS